MVDVNISTVALHNIASCQQLQELVMWGVVKGNSFRGLTQLTQLTRLTSLALETYHAGDDQHFSFTSEVFMSYMVKALSAYLLQTSHVVVDVFQVGTYMPYERTAAFIHVTLVQTATRRSLTHLVLLCRLLLVALTQMLPNNCC